MYLTFFSSHSGTQGHCRCYRAAACWDERDGPQQQRAFKRNAFRNERRRRQSHCPPPHLTHISMQWPTIIHNTYRYFRMLLFIGILFKWKSRKGEEQKGNLQHLNPREKDPSRSSKMDAVMWECSSSEAKFMNALSVQLESNLFCWKTGNRLDIADM